MDPLSWLYVVLILICVFFSAFYSASETAFGSISKYKYRVEAENGSTSAKLILWLYEHFQSTLIGILIGNNIVNLAASTMLTTLFLNAFGGSGIPEFWLSVISSVAMTIVIYLLGESIPKVAAKLNPDRFVKISVYPLTFLAILFSPLTFIFYWINKFFSLLFRTKDQSQISEEDFTNAVEHSEKKGVFEANESDILQASLDFTDTSVKEVLTPRSKMFMIDLKGLTREKLLDILRKTNYSRIPCYYEDPDKVIGVLVVKNYLNAYLQNRNVSLVSTLQKPYFITPGIKMDDLIEGFRKHKVQVAMVRKEGKLIGMVSTEDVLEELVGSINESNKVSVGGGKK